MDTSSRPRPKSPGAIPAWARRDALRCDGRTSLIRDIACPDRDDRLFPFLRNFDPYAGHSWASGGANFADGNNQESSSEAMNAWTGLILWGEAVGDRAIRDLGVTLYTNEMAAINEYWFDVKGENRPTAYTPSVVTLVWGGKGVNETWFTAQSRGRPRHQLAADPRRLALPGPVPGLRREELRRARGRERRDEMGRVGRPGLDVPGASDPRDAQRQMESAGGKAPSEAGNSPANTDHWIANLAKLGRVDAAVTADEPLAAVFRQGRMRTYCVYSPTDRPRTVRFSDGHRVDVNGKGFAISHRDDVQEQGHR